MTNSTTLPIDPKLGQHIADLINTIEVAKIIINTALTAEPYDDSKYKLWKKADSAARKELRDLGIPVL